MPDRSPAQSTTEAAALSAERRKGPRYSSDQVGSCHPAASDELTPVTIKDISLQGVGLVSNRRFEQGTVLILELGTAPAPLVTALARVVRLVRQADGSWLLGCALVNELAQEDFEVLRLAEANSGPGDRRGAVRLPLNRMASCRRFSPGALGQWPGEILDQSEGGLALLSVKEVESGAELRLDLSAHNEESPASLLVRVVRSERRPDGKWLLGCEITDPPREAPERVRKRP
jgi:hypothetical protein